MMTSRRRTNRLAMAVVVLAAALATAGCMGGDDSESQAGDKNGLPAQPPTTLAADSFGEPVTVTDKGTTHDGDVTIDRTTGRIYVSWAQDQRGKPKILDYSEPQDVYVVYSDDGGKTFSDPVRANQDAGQAILSFNNKLTIASTGENRLFASWSGWTYTTPEDHSPSNTMGALSTDGGATFAQEKAIRAADGKDTYEGYQAMATYGKNVYVGFLNYDEGGGGIRVVRSADGGKTFGRSTLAEASSCGCCGNALAANSKGVIFFAYRNVDAITRKTQVRDMTVVRSYDNGATWSDPVKLGDDDWEFNGCPESGPGIAFDDADTLHAVYWTGKPGRPGVYYTWSDDDGASFADPVAVAVDDFYPPPYIDVAVEGDGTGWIVWDDRRTKNRKVHLARVEDGKVETLEQPFAPGVTPAIDSDGSMVAMSWSDDKGVHVVVRGQAAKDGYGSGPGDAKSGQEDKKHAGH